MDLIPNTPAEERQQHLDEIKALRARVAGLETLLSQEITSKASLFKTITEHQGRYIDLVESAPWIVVRVDDGGRYVDANRYFAELIGEDKGSVLDEPVGSFGEGAPWREALTSFAASSDFRSEPRTVVLDVEGAPRSFLLLMHRPKPGASCTVLALDQTEREEALARAEASNREKSMFLAVMSHELRTPMNGVLGLAELLKRSALDEGQRNLVSTIESTGTTLVRIINDVLDLSKIENGAVDFEEVPFSVEESVRAVVATLGASARLSSATLGAEMPEDLPRVALGDPHRLQQVLTNLVGNALKFTPGGTVRVEVTWQADSDGAAEVTFRVHDDGIGIEASELGRLFEAFAQADSSVSRRYGGTGLGLTIARLLVQGMGGEIAASSRPGHGSTFEFTLRLAVVEETGGAARAAGPARGSSARAMRVLVAEDNLVNQRVARGMLEALGHEVSVASNGAEAVKVAGAESFDLVLMDVNMPVLDGLDATRRIRSLDAASSAVPIVALTANAIEGDRQICLDAGMDGYLSKPFTMDELDAAVAEFGDPLRGA